MTEKRFNMVIASNDGDFYYHDNVTGEKITSTLELEDKLNSLADENEELKKELDCFKPLIFETDGKPITLYEKKG